MMDFHDLSREIYHLTRDNNRHRKGAITFSCLGKIADTDFSCITRWKYALSSLLKKPLTDIPENPLVIGLAESGIIPSAILHGILREKGTNARWICSTRRKTAGIKFTESHSHAPDHILPVPLNSPGELWFMEDEITTGRTLLCLAISLCDYLNVNKIRIFSLADVRDDTSRLCFAKILKSRKIQFELHSLFPMNCSHKKNDCKLLVDDLPGMDKSIIAEENAGADEKWHFPKFRPALKSQLNTNFYMKNKITGSVLAVGEAVDIGFRMICKNPDLKMRHVTLSPWKIDGVNIVNRLDIQNEYYLYNIHTLRSPLHILSDPVDRDISFELSRLLAVRGYDIRYLEFNAK